MATPMGAMISVDGSTRSRLSVVDTGAITFPPGALSCSSLATPPFGAVYDVRSIGLLNLRRKLTPWSIGSAVDGEMPVMRGSV